MKSVFLVGRPRIFSEGMQFSLSDHYAVLGYVDCHPCHAGGTKTGDVRADRCGALAALRDQAARLEATEVRNMSRDAWQNSIAQQSRADAKTLSESVERQQREIRERQKRRETLREKAFGADSLFALDVGEITLPPRASELKVCPGAVGLFGPRTLSSPPPVGLPRSGTPEGSLTNAFVQVLLRRRIVLQWLSAHNGSSCARSGEDDGECFACLLRETLAQMHLPSRAGMARSSPLAVNAAWAKSCIDVGLRKLFQSVDIWRAASMARRQRLHRSPLDRVGVWFRVRPRGAFLV